MSGDLINRFLGYLKHYNLSQHGDTILIAFSGGRDSTTLVDLFMRIRESRKLTIALAHFNHKLRGAESEGDAEHCRITADKLGLDYYYDEADVAGYAQLNKRSIEEAAHLLRYQFLHTSAGENGFSKVATAHTADDQAETIVMHFLRGGNWQSLHGIPRQRGDIIRPVLWCTRKEITDYLNYRNLTWREDSSNYDYKYERNRVRNELLVLIKEKYNPNITQILQHWGVIFEELREFAETVSHGEYSKIIEEKNENEIILHKEPLQILPGAVQRIIIQKAISQFFQEYTPFSSSLELCLMQGINNQQPGKTINLGNGKTLLFDRDRLILYKEEARGFYYPVELNEKYTWNDNNLEFESRIVSENEERNKWDELIDYEAVKDKALAVRSWIHGDVFIPFGQNGTCKISDFFINKKIQLHKKNSIPLFTAGNEIIWICGYRISETARITDNTKIQVGIRCRYE